MRYRFTAHGRDSSETVTNAVEVGFDGPSHSWIVKRADGDEIVFPSTSHWLWFDIERMGDDE